MSDDKPIGRLTLMVRAADTARADIALTPDRIYYRFATDESIEDGELPGTKEEFDSFCCRLLDSVAAREAETPLADEIKLSIFTDNHTTDIKVSEQSLRRMVNELKAIADEFAFLGGFC